MSGAVKTVMVTEDDSLIRMAAARALEDAGFCVIEAEHAASALAQLQVHFSTVDLLFTDIHMPGEMDGLALAQQVRRSWSHIAVILASGKARPMPHLMPAGSLFFSKPYDLAEVTTQVRALTA